jgi:hypothetical protein
MVHFQSKNLTFDKFFEVLEVENYSIFNGNLGENFTRIFLSFDTLCGILPFRNVVPRKIWQPC